MKKINRETAVQLGLKRFFTGIPCKNGHICERLSTVRSVSSAIGFVSKGKKNATLSGSTEKSAYQAKAESARPRASWSAVAGVVRRRKAKKQEISHSRR